MIIIAALLLTIFHPGIIFRGGNWQRCDFAVLTRKPSEQKDRGSLWSQKASVDSQVDTVVERIDVREVEKMEDGPFSGA